MDWHEWECFIPKIKVSIYKSKALFRLMEAGGTQLDPDGPGGTRWDMVGPGGIWWDPVGYGGTLWDPVGTSGNQWEPVGTSGNQWDPVATRWDQLGVKPPLPCTSSGSSATLKGTLEDHSKCENPVPISCPFF